MQERWEHYSISLAFFKRGAALISFGRTYTLLTHSFRAWLAPSLAAMSLLTLPMPSHAQTTPSSSASTSDESDFTEAQKSRVTARQERFKQDVAALRANPKLTDVQKQAKYLVLMQALDKDMMAVLTPAQRAQVVKQQEINTKFQKAVVALRANTKLTDAQKQAAYKTLVQNRQNELLSTLSPTQRARVEKEHQAEVARATEVNRLGEQIQKSESPDQVKKIHDISLTTRQRMQAVIADKTLPEQTKVGRITELREQAQAKINALLTQKQRAEFAHLQELVGAPPAP